MKKLFYIATIASLLFSCKQEVAEEKVIDDGLITVTEAQFQSSKMEIGSPIEQDFEVTVKSSGKIDVPPQYRAKVTTFLGGYVKATKLLVGDKVAKGQALITLENTDYLDLQKDYVEVAEQINYLKSEFERQKTLYNEKITSQKNYLKAESDYRQAKGMYQGLREKLMLLNINPANVERGKFTSQITISAPISGDVTVMNANVGMFMSPSDVILEIVDTNYLHLNLSIFEKDILHVKQGQKINFKVPEASKESFSSNVQLVGKSIESKDRTISVFGTLSPEIRGKLLSGMFVEANIITAAKKGFGVPSDAIITENDKHYLLVLSSKTTEYKFKKTAVTLGEKSEKFIEIIPNDNVNTKTKLLTKGVFELTN
ncbi:efflux RND transporter periplasmic adaptor subunit [Flavobacterium sp.]|uniref:efflux RND transporter periplasmic adaptor subunit n=1 Tax=Flavobacterium sp. TaxID=239 RepID=UPI0008B03DD4|nr:efflux RND transporter periplasmic adaptor subunit [Flavobacterium sp.]OGS61608.1 MAG: efflux transporter periplasmic adaptor subunit [Flavobacteria bacterium GWF1_32_7]HBD27234.1 efflux transporter periplasmic adaptor subunit [Flavobacterium sp.]